MRRPIIAGNWKMNKNLNEALDFVEKIPTNIKGEKKVEMVVCSTFLCLDRLAQALKNTTIGLGAQNMYWENSGAFTGEVSGSMLKDIGCKYVIIGQEDNFLATMISVLI